MRNFFTILVLVLIVATNAIATIGIQNSDVATLAAIVSAGGNSTQLINDTKLYSTVLSSQLSTALSSGNIANSTAPFLMVQQSTPANPAALSDKLYFKSDNKLYGLSSAGVESLIGPAGATSLTNAHIFVGNASNVATDVAVSGDLSVVNTGAFTITNGAVTNAKVAAGAAIDFSKLAALPSADLLVGSGANVATAVAASGDVSLANTGAFTVNTVGGSSASNINSAVNQVLQGSNKLLYVNAGYVGAATSDGSVLRPYVAIMDAVNRIISNNDGANYVIMVAPGTYSETISLNNAALTRLAIVANSSADGSQSNDAIPITSLTGDINSTSNNDNLKALIFRGLDMQGNIIFTGASTGTNFCQFGCAFVDMIVYSTGAPAINLTNVGQVIFQNLGTAIQAGAGGVTIQNANFVGVYNTFLNLGAISLVTNNGANKPSGFGGTSVQTSFGNRLGATSVDAGSTLTQRFERVSGALTSSGSLSSVQSAYLSAITLSAGTMTSLGDIFTAYPTLSGGTFTPSGSYAYTPTTSANWNTVPTTIQGGLDTLATSGVVKAQSANTLLAGPTTGGATVPAFRSLVAADIPALPYASSTLTSAHLFVGNGSNVATDVVLSGDATLANTGALTIANNAVSNAKLAQMPTNTIKGNNTGGTANALDLTTTQVTAMLNQFTTTLQGVVPGSGGGSTNFLRADGTWAAPSGTGGTVTSVAFSDASSAPIFTITGSPVTTSGTLTETLSTQTANTVFSGPTTGGATQPTFRSLVAADIPLISLTTGVSGVLPIANGGTNSSAALNNNRVMTSSGGAIVEAAAITANKALASNASGIPVASTTTDTELGFVSGVTSSIQTQLNAKQSTTLTNTHLLVGNASNVATDVAASGDLTLANTGAFTLNTVNGNVGSFGSSTSIPSFTVNAKGLVTAASGNVVIAPAGTLSGTTLNSSVVSSSLTSVGTITSGTWNGTTVDVAHGGTSLTTLTANNVILGNGTSAPTFVAPGTSGNVLTSNGTTWTSAASSSGATGFYGSLNYASTANCSWSISSPTSTFTSFSNQGNCPSATVSGNASAPGTKIPGITFVSLPAGDYLFNISMRTTLSSALAPEACSYTLFDGSTTYGDAINQNPTGVNDTYGQGFSAYLHYGATQSNITIQIQTKASQASPGACGVDSGTTAKSTPFTITAFKL